MVAWRLVKNFSIASVRHLLYFVNEAIKKFEGYLGVGGFEGKPDIIGNGRLKRLPRLHDFKEKIKGYISYVRGDDTNLFPKRDFKGTLDYKITKNALNNKEIPEKI